MHRIVCPVAGERHLAIVRGQHARGCLSGHVLSDPVQSNPVTLYNSIDTTSPEAEHGSTHAIPAVNADSLASFC